MFVWLENNLINLVLVLVIAALVFFVIRGMLRDKKAGKCACGGSCGACGGNCGACGACTGAQRQDGAGPAQRP